jgi:hypothetical protein
MLEVAYSVYSLRLWQLHTDNSRKASSPNKQCASTTRQQQLIKSSCQQLCSCKAIANASHTLLVELQEAARLMAAGDYEAALPVAMEAVALGEQLFKPQPALQLFPLYLLAAQVGAATRQETMLLWYT